MSEINLNEQQNQHYVCAIQNLTKYECAKCKFSTHFKVHFYKHKNSFCSTKQQQYICATQNLTKYCCSVCNYTTDFKVCLVKHEHNSEKEVKVRTYTCQKCKKFRSNSRLVVMKHEYEGQKEKCRPIKPYKRKATQVYYKCKHCPFESNRRFLVKSHSVRLHCSKDICTKCQFCGHQIKTAGGMRYHIFSHHTVKNDEVYECIPCGFKTNLKVSYIKHQHYHRYKNLYCTQCSYVTKSRYNLLRHTKGKHSSPEKIAWLKCEYCPFKTKWPSGLKRHARQNRCNPENAVFSIKEFECGFCSMKTNNRHNLEQHIRAKHLNTKHINTKVNTRRINKKLCKCDFCPFEAKKHILNKHLLFVHKIPLKTKTYSGVKDGDVEKKFECYNCGFRTTKKRFLARHIKNAHMAPESIKWFECEYCFFQTKLKGNLTKHIKCRHSAPEDIDWKQCEFCEYKAKKNSNLQCHLAKYHTNKVET